MSETGRVSRAFYLSLAVLTLLFVVGSSPLLSALRNRGLSEPVAVMIVFGGFATIACALLGLASWRRRTSRAEFAKRSIFVIVTISALVFFQTIFFNVLESWGCPEEFRFHAAWLAAILTVGVPGEYFRRRLGIEVAKR